MRKAVLLVNLGTPDSPSVSDVRKYLKEFLNDPYVMTMPWLWRKILVNMIIVPFRSPKSAKIYRELWTDEGSPLMIYGLAIQKLLQAQVGDSLDVHLAMRYQNPGMDKVIAEMERKGYDEVTIIPLYPQYASSSTETTIVHSEKLFSKWNKRPQLKFVQDFFDHPKFIDAFVARVNQYEVSSYDHILFSYHSLPKSHLVEYKCKGESCDTCHCNQSFDNKNRQCYKGACEQTTHLIADKLGLNENQYSLAYQSRLYKGWLEPFSDHELIELAKQGKKRLLVVCPSFVADCLETTVEIGIEYTAIFQENGGEELQLVESLNEHSLFIDCLAMLSN